MMSSTSRAEKAGNSMFPGSAGYCRYPSRWTAAAQSAASAVRETAAGSTALHPLSDGLLGTIHRTSERSSTAAARGRLWNPRSITRSRL